MKQNKKRKTLHSALKANRLEREGGGRRRRTVCAVLAVILLVALGVGATIAYGKLRGLWIRQCAITDVSRQVEIVTGPNIKAGVILESFGLRKGANLALIDFAEKRTEILGRIPNIRTITVARHLPDRVTISVEERDPVARLATRGNRNTGLVVDDEGVVFRRQTGVQTLPTITDKNEPAAGSKLAGRASAALRLLEECRDGRFAVFALLDVNASPADYLYATLGNYTFAKIAWEGMDEPIASTHDAMIEQLDNFLHAYNSGTTGPGTVWNVMLKGRAFADTKEPIL